MNKFKNERNLGLASKHVDDKGQVSRNGFSLVEMLNVVVRLWRRPEWVASRPTPRRFSRAA